MGDRRLEQRRLRDVGERWRGHTARAAAHVIGRLFVDFATCASRVRLVTYVAHIRTVALLLRRRLTCRVHERVVGDCFSSFVHAGTWDALLMGMRRTILLVLAAG